MKTWYCPTCFEVYVTEDSAQQRYCANLNVRCIYCREYKMSAEAWKFFTQDNVQTFIKEVPGAKVILADGHAFALETRRAAIMTGCSGPVWRAFDVGSDHEKQWEKHYADALTTGRAWIGADVKPEAPAAEEPRVGERTRWHVESPRPDDRLWKACASDGSGRTGFAEKDDTFKAVATLNNDWRVTVIGENNVSHVENIMRPDVRKFFAREDVRADVAKLRANGADHFLMMVHTEHGLIAWRGDDFCTVRYDYPHRSLSWGRKSKSEYSTHSVEDVYREGRMLIESDAPLGTKLVQDVNRTVIWSEPKCGDCGARAVLTEENCLCIYCERRAAIFTELDDTPLEKRIAEAKLPEVEYGDVGPWDQRDVDYEL